VLLIGGIPVTTVAAEHGTPLYVYDGDMIRDRCAAVADAFPSFDVFYSVKANSSLGLAGFLRRMGAGAEIASGGELHLAREAGFDPLDIVFAGPGKTDREIEDAIVAGIFAINAESVREVERIARVSRLLGVPARVALRVNTTAGLSSPGVGSAGPLHERMAGGPSRFGIDEEKLNRVMEVWNRRAVDIVGVHVYTASQVLDADEIVENARRTVAVARVVEGITERPVASIDFGGGIGVPHYEDESPVDLPALGARVEEVFGPYAEADARLIIELGRYLVSDSGIFVSRVVELKESRGERFVITDGGVNQFLRPVLMEVDHEARVVNRLGSAGSSVARVGGPLCTPIDATAREMRVPDDIALDDLVGVFNAGAYGYSMSPLLFLSHPTPAEVMVLDGEIVPLRKRGTYEDLLRNQHSFPGAGR
jgi:diaminopimelate decarboxylase